MLRADTGQLTLDGSGSGSLTVEDVDDITWFADRPAHDAGRTDAVDMLERFGWTRNGDTLGESAPNAAITAAGIDETIVVELNAASRDGGTLTFAVTGVGTSGPVDVTVSDITMFIDSVSTATYPQTMSADLPNLVMANTTVSLVSDMQVATVEFTSELGSLGSVTLSEEQPTAENVEFDLGEQTLRLDVISFQAASGASPGEVVAYGSVTDVRGMNFDSFSDSIASWGP